MRPCARRGCPQYTVTHPTLCYFDSKRDSGLLDASNIRGKPRRMDPSDVVSGERQALIRGLQALGANEMQVRVALGQVNPRHPSMYSPHWKGRRLQVVR